MLAKSGKTMFKKVYYTWGEDISVQPEGQSNMTSTHYEGLRERTYLVQCWVHPSSGKDLVEKNKVLDEFKFFLNNVFHDDKNFNEGLEQFEREIDGFVLRPFFLKTFHEVSKPEVEFLSQIRVTNPEAKFASCQEVPNSK